MEHAIGIDLGGTQIKAALVDMRTGERLCSDRRPTFDGETDSETGLPAFVPAVTELLEELEAGAGLGRLAVGLAAPGIADPDGTCIRWMGGRMEGIEGLDWSATLGRPVRVLNDANAALLGEIWTGAAQGCTDVMMLTLGTGVGGAVLSGGRLLTGKRGRAGHLGHISLDAFGGRDAYQTPGSLEQAIGNLTVERRTAGRFPSTLDLATAAASGDPEAVRWWEESLQVLAAAIASLINVVDPEKVIIGGGIASGAGMDLFEPLRRMVRGFEWCPGGMPVPIEAATAGEWAGVVGAAHHLQREDLALPLHQV